MIGVRKTSVPRNMLGIAKSPSTRIVCRALLWLRMMALALLGCMFLAASAYADAPASEEPTAPTAGESQPTTAPPSSESPQQSSPPPVEAPSASTTPPTQEESSPGGSSTQPPSEEHAPETSSPPPAETPPVTTPPIEEPLATPPPPPPPPPPVEVPVEISIPPVHEPAPEVTVVTPVSNVPEATKVLPKVEETPEVLATHVVGGEESPAGSITVSQPSSPPPPPAGGLPVEASGLSSALTSSSVPGPPSGETVTASAIASELSPSTVARIATPQRQAGLGCKLSALEGTITSSCAVSLLAPRSLLPTPAAALATATAPWTAGSDGTPPDSGHGATTEGSHPSNPAPGPAPSGASGGSASGGGSGLALSAFMTLAGLLLLAAPRALCRLRLACRPFLTAFFVLIPERPG